MRRPILIRKGTRGRFRYEPVRRKLAFNFALLLFDLAGTLVDLKKEDQKGSMAPVLGFQRAIKEVARLDVPEDLVRKHMGAGKKEHAHLVLFEQMLAEFIGIHHRPPTPQDVDLVYLAFQRHLELILPDYSNLDPRVEALLRKLKLKSKLVTTTGYYRKANEIVLDVSGIQEKDLADLSLCIDDCGTLQRSRATLNRRAMRELNVGLARVLASGDTKKDRKGALDSGIEFCGFYETGNTSLEEFMAMEIPPEYLIPGVLWFGELFNLELNKFSL